MTPINFQGVMPLQKTQIVKNITAPHFKGKAYNSLERNPENDSFNRKNPTSKSIAFGNNRSIKDLLGPDGEPRFKGDPEFDELLELEAKGYGKEICSLSEHMAKDGLPTFEAMDIVPLVELERQGYGKDIREFAEICLENGEPRFFGSAIKDFVELKNEGYGKEINKFINMVNKDGKPLFEAYDICNLVNFIKVGFNNEAYALANIVKESEKHINVDEVSAYVKFIYENRSDIISSIVKSAEKLNIEINEKKVAAFIIHYIINNIVH